MEKKLSHTTTVTKQTTVPGEVIPLLLNTFLGTPGKTLYQHLQTATKIYDIRHPFFFTLKRLGTLICTVCLAWRKTELAASEPIDSFYIRYFVANPTFRGKGHRNKKVRSNEPNGIIKQFMENVFSSGSSIQTFSPHSAKALFYAYVESENEQSMHLCHHYRFRPVREMVTVAFSRFSPHAHSCVRKAQPHEYDVLRQRVEAHYAVHSFVCTEHLFYQDNYFVAEQDGRVVAGLQANPTQWAIKNLPGASGKVLIRILPFVPYLRRLINPNKFSFSAIEGIFYEDGCEWAIGALLETAIAAQGYHSALMWFDSACPVLTEVRKHCELGLVDKINASGCAEIIVRGQNLTDEDWLWLENTPAYISCFDLT